MSNLNMTTIIELHTMCTEGVSRVCGTLRATSGLIIEVFLKKKMRCLFKDIYIFIQSAETLGWVLDR